MSREETIAINSESIKKYLDDCIEFWRKENKLPYEDRKSKLPRSKIHCYIDAFQSMRTSLFGETKS